MSLRTFTVFQDAVSSNTPQPKITRPNAMVTRSSSLNLITSSSNTMGSSNDLVALDKENFHPVTGERAGPSNTGGSKKRKTSVLATKVQPLSTTTTTKDAQPEVKKRKASTSISKTTKGKAKRDGKTTVTARKGSSKRTISRKVSPMPKLNEEEEPQKDRVTQVDIDSRCYELTVQPLADVSQAYDEGIAFEGLPTSPREAKLKFSAAKASSAEPEIRDYFEPSRALFSSTASRFSSEEVPEGRTFSTPERKQIYAAFTFSSPSPSSGRMSKLSRSGSPSPAKLA